MMHVGATYFAKKSGLEMMNKECNGGTYKVIRKEKNEGGETRHEI